MGFSFGPEQSPKRPLWPERRLELDFDQGLKTGNILKEVSWRIQILQALYPGEPADPKGDCPSCRRTLTIEEILRGFLDQVEDTTTACPACGTRFQPLIVGRFGQGKLLVPFLCAKQTLGRLREIASNSFDYICSNHQQVVASARFHFGTVTKAYQQIGIDFIGEPALTWKDKVRPFLGQCSDALIAEVVNASPATVRRYRVSLGIETFPSQTTVVN
jgi:hypothetical protein